MFSDNTKMILIMGVTGSGKSHFINTLLGKRVTKEYAGLKSGTQKCQIIQTEISEEAQLAIVDTPGFDDSERPDVEILEEITRILVTQHRLGIPLEGIVFLHRITDQKMQGTSLRYFQMFQKIVGEKALSSVALVTTMWDKLKDQAEGLARDEQLRKEYWNLMEEKGSEIFSFDDSKEMAEEIIIKLLSKEPVVLSIQKELAENEKTLEDTVAGQFMAPRVRMLLNQSSSDLDNLGQQIANARKAGRRTEVLVLEKSQQSALEAHRKGREGLKRLKRKPAQDAQEEIEDAQEKLKKGPKSSRWKDGLQIFATVTGLAITIVFHLLPIFGIDIE